MALFVQLILNIFFFSVYGSVQINKKKGWTICWFVRKTLELQLECVR